MKQEDIKQLQVRYDRVKAELARREAKRDHAETVLHEAKEELKALGFNSPKAAREEMERLSLHVSNRLAEIEEALRQ